MAGCTAINLPKAGTTEQTGKLRITYDSCGRPKAYDIESGSPVCQHPEYGRSCSGISVSRCDPRNFSSCAVVVDTCGRRSVQCPKGYGSDYDTACTDPSYGLPCSAAQEFDPLYQLQKSCPPTFDISDFSIDPSMANQAVNISNNCGRVQVIYDQCGRPQYNYKATQYGSAPLKDVFTQHPLWGNKVCDDKLKKPQKCGKPFMTDSGPMSMVDRYAYLNAAVIYMNALVKAKKVPNFKALASVSKAVTKEMKKIFPAALKGKNEYGDSLGRCFDLRSYKNSLAFGSDVPFAVSWVVSSVSTAYPTLTPDQATKKIIEAAQNYASTKWVPPSLIATTPIADPVRGGIQGLGESADWKKIGGMALAAYIVFKIMK